MQRIDFCKKKEGFRAEFIRQTKEKKKNKIRIPKFELEDIEDYYTYYVLILEISENLFWNADISFLKTVALNKSAYDSWKNYAINEERDRAYGKN
jgi:hypothetical protein|nr:MAG TPA: hypothetical protein [Caudoviricetes sp.]